MQKISVWNGTAQTGTQYPSLQNNITADVAIVGGGITGIATAYLLAQKGFKPVVLEALEIGGGTTSHSTGNLYCMVDEKFHKVKSKFDKETAQKVAQSRAEAVNLIEQWVQQHGIDCDFIRTPWVYYSMNEDDSSLVEKEYETVKEIGLNCHLSDAFPGLPYPTYKTLMVENQAQFHPLKFVQGLATAATQAGVQIYERSKVINFEEKDNTYILHTENASVSAAKVVMATHIPKGFDPIQTLLYPYREYGVAVTLKSGHYPQGILWGIKDFPKKISLRSYSANGQNYLMAIGENYKTGHNEHNEKSFAKLEEFLRKNFDVAEVAYRWGGQHYKSADSIAYIGRAHNKPDMYFATGFATDGLTYGVLSGMIISDLIAGIQNKYAEVYDPKRFTLVASAGKFVKENLDVAAQYLKDIPFKGDVKELDDVAAGEGKVVVIDGSKYGAYRDENNALHVVSAVCPHMKCIVNWNEGEKSWDCPCHGSRFTFEGRVIEGPAISDLEKLQYKK